MVRLETIERMIQEAVSDWKGLLACAYQGADDPTYTMYVTGDATQYLSLGMRIKLTQTTDKFFILTGIGSYDSGNNRTLLTMYGGTDYDLANTTIVSPSYSSMKAPLGFPMDIRKWTVEYGWASNGSGNYTEANGWTQLGSVQTDIPIGSWVITWGCSPYLTTTSASYDYQLMRAYIALSTSNNSASDDYFVNYLNFGTNATSAVGNVRPIYSSIVHRSRNYIVTTKTTFYIIGFTQGDDPNYVRLFASLGGNGYIFATCAYL